MYTLERIFKLLGILIILLAIFASQVFIGIAILSMLIVPSTLLYCKIVGRSYNSTIDRSNILYKLNKLGQYALLSAVGLLIFYFFIRVI